MEAGKKREISPSPHLIVLHASHGSMNIFAGLCWCGHHQYGLPKLSVSIGAGSDFRLFQVQGLGDYS
jgi:hypothetical protein